MRAVALLATLVLTFFVLPATAQPPEAPPIAAAPDTASPAEPGASAPDPEPAPAADARPTPAEVRDEVLADIRRGDYEAVVTLLLPPLVALAGRFVLVLLLLLAAIFVGAWAKRAAQRGLGRAHVDVTVASFLGNVLRYGILTLAVVVCLGTFGVNMTSFAAVVGAAALAIGLSFQGALSNLASGLMLLIFRPFRVGDAVKIGGESGVIEEIELVYTRLRKFDRTMLVVPNKQVIEGVIENFSRTSVRRVSMPVGVSYDTDPDAAVAALERAAGMIESALKDPAPVVVAKGFGDSSVNYELLVYCASADLGRCTLQTQRAIWRTFRDAEISIPFPQRDLNITRPIAVTLGRE